MLFDTNILDFFFTFFLLSVQSNLNIKENIYESHLFENTWVRAFKELLRKSMHPIVHMTGYAGSRDYVGTRILRRRPHTFLYIPLKNRLRLSYKNSVRVAKNLK